MVGPTVGYKSTYRVWPPAREGLMFYSFAHRLANGFIRNGHFVVTLNDRDSRRLALSVRPAGAWLANRRLIKMAADVQPDLLCLQHCDLIWPETIARVRQMVPHCRVVVVHYDSIWGTEAQARVTRFLPHADFAFLTTAGADLLRLAGPCPVAFIPNPVDASIDSLTAYAFTHKDTDVFFAGGAGLSAERWRLIDELRDRKPELRYALHGRARSDRLLGDAYYRALRTAKIGLNLNRHEGNLYASDRLAQYLGNGLLVASHRRSGYEHHFSDGEMLFFDDAEELGDKVAWVIADDQHWRKMAEAGRAHAHQIMGGQLVTDFIARMAFGWDEPADWAFGREIYRPAHAAPAPPSRTSTPRLELA